MGVPSFLFFFFLCLYVSTLLYANVVVSESLRSEALSLSSLQFAFILIHSRAGDAISYAVIALHQRCARVEMKCHNVKPVYRLGRFTRASCAALVRGPGANYQESSQTTAKIYCYILDTGTVHQHDQKPNDQKEAMFPPY
jgi:hypothetical protein